MLTTKPERFKIYCLTVLILYFSVNLGATTYNVSSVSQFNALPTLLAGDVVEWADGTYNSDDLIAFLGTGTAASPIILKSETPGGVIFNNGLKMNIAGSHLIVDGFYWQGGFGASNFIQFRNGTTYGQNCTIQNCAIDGLQVHPDDLEVGTSVKHRWVVLYGNYNNVLNCSFMNKSNAGATVLVELEYNALVDRCAVVGHTISNNYFYNYEKINTALTNAGDSETIRVGTSEFQNVDCQTTVSNNYFVEADGENEIITNKSDNNLYFNNTFRRCRGSLVLRHGSGATVNQNYFLGENVDGTGGIRIVDSDHSITNNYIQDCITVIDQAIWNNGFTFLGGSQSSQDNCNSTSVSNGYQEVDDILLSNNTIVNTNAPLFYNINKGSNDPTGTVSNNLIYFEPSSANLSNVLTGNTTSSYAQLGTALTYSGNIYDGTALGENNAGFANTSLTAIPNGEIFDFGGAGTAGADMGSYVPFVDTDVANGIGACFLSANGTFINATVCNGTIIPPPPDYLVVSSPTIFPAGAVSQVINISSNINWIVSNSNSWFTVSPASGSGNANITINVSANSATTPRSGSFTVSGAGIVSTITVNQEADQIVVNPSGPNLALNQPVFATGVPDGANVPANITDDDTNTRWSVSGFPQSATIDLGAVYQLESTAVVCYNDRAYQFIIEVATSINGPYTQVVNRSANTEPGTPSDPIDNSFSAINGQFVRITVTGANVYTGSWVSLTEVRVYGQAACPASLVLSGTLLTDETTQVQGHIESTQVIKTTTNVTYDAGTYISLDTGFEVESGAIFSAEIDGCN